MSVVNDIEKPKNKFVCPNCKCNNITIEIVTTLLTKINANTGEEYSSQEILQEDKHLVCPNCGIYDKIDWEE